MTDSIDPQNENGSSLNSSLIIAILDTGVDANHPFFSKAKILPQIDFDESFREVEREPEDLVGHGTAVAGIIHGLVPDAILLPVRVLTDGPRQHRHRIIHQGALTALNRGATILNCSFGVPASPQTCLLYKQWVDQAFDLGRYVVAASPGEDETYPEWPSSFRSAFAISNTPSNASKAVNYANRPMSYLVDGNEVNVPTLNHGFTQLTGCSFSTASFTGGLAKLLGAGASIFSNLSESELTDAITG